MPKLQVLVSEHGEVLGTYDETGESHGGSAPTGFGFHARDGQRVVHLEVDDATARLAPDDLHASLSRRARA
jgi:hypothetical protein